MDWKEQLEKFERSRDWKSAVELMQRVVEGSPDDVEASVRAIYLLHNILVEEDLEPQQLDHDALATLLKQYFDESYEKFSENAEYLFFVGKILHIAEWYFGLDDRPGPIEQSLAFKMQKKAFEKEPDNVLYEWAYAFSKDDRPRACALSERLLHGEPDEINWLKARGFPGQYMLESLEYCAQHCTG